MVIILGGRYAGKKAVIVKNFEEGDTNRPYGHALVAGVERTPLKASPPLGKPSRPSPGWPSCRVRLQCGTRLLLTPAPATGHAEDVAEAGGEALQAEAVSEDCQLLARDAHALQPRQRDRCLAKAAVNKADIKEPTKKRAARNKVKAIFEGRYTQGQNPWFFSKLRF